MANDDPFERLRKKLEAKKKAGRKQAPAGAPSQRPAGAPPPARKPAASRRPPGAPPPVRKPAASGRPAGAPPPARKPAASRRPPGAPPPIRKPAGGGSWLDDAGSPAKGKPRRVVPKAKGGGSPGSGKPLKIIRTAWTTEDLDRMRKSKETTKDGPPAGFTSHRYDSGIDPKRVRARKDTPKEPVRRPKGFRSDRADRG
jgi:hypothetical protein